MKYGRLLLSIALIGSLATSVPAQTKAATLPVQGVDVLVKSKLSKWVTATKTDNNGYFTMHVIEPNGTYNVFFSDESNEPVEIKAKNAVVAGRIVLLTDNTTTQEPAEAAIAAMTPKVATNMCPKIVPVIKTARTVQSINNVPFLLRPISHDGTTLDGASLVHLISLP